MEVEVIAVVAVMEAVVEVATAAVVMEVVEITDLGVQKVVAAVVMEVVEMAEENATKSITIVTNFIGSSSIYLKKIGMKKA